MHGRYSCNPSSLYRQPDGKILDHRFCDDVLATVVLDDVKQLYRTLCCNVQWKCFKKLSSQDIECESSCGALDKLYGAVIVMLQNEIHCLKTKTERIDLLQR